MRTIAIAAMAVMLATPVLAVSNEYIKGYNAGYENGYNEGVGSVKSEADLLAWIKEQTGMKPSKLIKDWNAQKEEIADLEEELEEAQTEVQVWQDKAGCALLEIQGIDDIDEVKQIVYDCVVTKNEGNPLN